MHLLFELENEQCVTRNQRDTALNVTRIARGRAVRVQVLSFKQTIVSACRSCGRFVCVSFSSENRRYYFRFKKYFSVESRINIRAFILPRCRYCAPRTKKFRNEGKHSDVRFRFDDRNDDLNQIVFHSIPVDLPLMSHHTNDI